MSLESTGEMGTRTVILGELQRARSMMFVTSIKLISNSPSLSELKPDSLPLAPLVKRMREVKGHSQLIGYILTVGSFKEPVSTIDSGMDDQQPT